jgi:hypothetical protein
LFLVVVVEVFGYLFLCLFIAHCTTLFLLHLFWVSVTVFLCLCVSVFLFIFYFLFNVCLCFALSGGGNVVEVVTVEQPATVWCRVEVAVTVGVEVKWR